MNICINYYGQPRTLEHAKNTYNHLFANLPYSIHVLYTTWDHTDTTKYKGLFPMAHIRQIPQPTEESYEYYERNYRQYTFQRTMANYMIGLFLKKETLNTICEYETKNNIKFDVIITLRVDTLINLERSISWCCEEAIINKNSVYVGDHHRFDILGIDACPDACVITSRDSSFKILTQHDNIDECCFMYEDEKTVHPETSCYLNYKYHECNIVYVPGIIFANEAERSIYTKPDSYNESVYRKYRQ